MRCVLQDEPVVQCTQNRTLTDLTGCGAFKPDAWISVDQTQAYLRAERCGDAAGRGRAYRVEFVATDVVGEQCTGSKIVTVAHDQSKYKPFGNQGALYDSTVDSFACSRRLKS